MWTCKRCAEYLFFGPGRTFRESAAEHHQEGADGRGDDREFLTELYWAVLGHAPDKMRLGYWQSRLEKGESRESVFNAVASSLKARLLQAGRGRPLDFGSADVSRLLKEHDFPGMVVVDIGAQKLKDEEDIYVSLRRHGLVKTVIGFEPLQKRAKLRKQGDVEMVVHPYALGDGMSHTFYINNFDATSSFYPLNPDAQTRYVDMDRLSTVKTSTIPTTRLDEIALPDVIDLLKIDVQGYELPILEHGRATLNKTGCLITEVEFQPIYSGQPLFSDIDTFARTNGFRLHDIVRQERLPIQCANPIPMASELCWADAVYFNTSETLDPSTLLSKAAVSHFVFQWFNFSDVVL